jgi:hypothetical protein
METRFDVNRIVKISFKKKDVDTDWVKRPFVPSKTRFFGLIKISPIPAGWEYVRDHGFRRYSDEEVLRYGARIIEGDSVFEKPIVTIKLDHSEVWKRFDTNDEAIAWIKELEVRSNKDFEII